MTFELLLFFFLETAFFNVQTIREIKIENKKLGGKKRFPQFLLSMYVFCVFVCLFVCLSVIALQTSSFDIGVWNFNIDTYIKISQNGIFYFFEFLLFFGVIPLFHFWKPLLYRCNSTLRLSRVTIESDKRFPQCLPRWNPFYQALRVHPWT